MAREALPGLILKERDLMVAFTYGCNDCPVKTQCEPVYHLQETPRAIRGNLAGDPDQCLIIKDERWASDVQVLEPKRI